MYTYIRQCVYTFILIALHALSVNTLSRLPPRDVLPPSPASFSKASAISPDGGAWWRDCIEVSPAVLGRVLTPAYPFTYPRFLQSVSVLFVRLLSPGFQGLMTISAFSFPCARGVLRCRQRWQPLDPLHPRIRLPLPTVHCVLSIFQISPTSIFLCKVSASGVRKGHPPDLSRNFFQVFGVRLLLIQKLHGPRMKKMTAIPCLCTPSSCLLLHARKININLKNYNYERNEQFHGYRLCLQGCRS